MPPSKLRRAGPQHHLHHQRSSKAMASITAGTPPYLRLKIVFPLLALFLCIGYTGLRLFASKEESGGGSKDVYGVYSYKVVNEYDHDPRAFTQGLLYAGNDTFFESTGMYGQSSVRKVYLPSGKVLQLHELEQNSFGEGLTLWDGRLFQVAWRVTSGFIYDANTLTLLGAFNHSMKDGWGLATDGKILYGSDGTSTIYVMDPSTFREARRFIVKDQGKEINRLNELEIVDGELWANVWLTDCIVRISPKDGQVLGWILLHGLKSDLLASGDKFIDVLNGIAWDSEKSRLFVTGKYWPKLYEINIVPYGGDDMDREHVWHRCRV